jgi:hypothetical protein
MKKYFPVLVVFWGLGSFISLSASAQQVRSYKCEDERVQANLHIEYPVEFHGVVHDPSGATFSQIILQLRKPHEATALKSAAVDEKGRFDFGIVPSGEFRLVPTKFESNKVTRVPGFDPPRSLTCSSSKVCELQIVLPVRATDQPYTFCPPK